MMNLPLEYSILAKYFDVGPIAVNRTIEKILKKHKVKTVLDLTCGTGSQVFWLAERDYTVTGADLSPALLKIAKIKARKEKIKVKLLAGDMRTLQVGHFDAVITIFNSVGHLTKADFAKAIRNINKNLNQGGLYIFDIFNLNSMNDRVVASLKMDNIKTVGNSKIRHIQYSKLDKKCGRLVSYDHYSLQEKTNKPKIFKSKFALQIYSAKELREMLARNGFKVTGQYGIDGSKFLEKRTQGILTFAEKL